MNDGEILFFPTSDDKLDDDPPAPDEDDWEGPEDDDEMGLVVHHSVIPGESHGEWVTPRIVRDCNHRFPNRRCPVCGDDE